MGGPTVYRKDQLQQAVFTKYLIFTRLANAESIKLLILFILKMNA